MTTPSPAFAPLFSLSCTSFAITSLCIHMPHPRGIGYLMTSSFSIPSSSTYSLPYLFNSSQLLPIPSYPPLPQRLAQPWTMQGVSASYHTLSTSDPPPTSSPSSLKPQSSPAPPAVSASPSPRPLPQRVVTSPFSASSPPPTPSSRYATTTRSNSNTTKPTSHLNQPSPRASPKSSKSSAESTSTSMPQAS